MRTLSVITMVVVSFSCIDPIRLDVPDGSGALVIDGLISDQPGPYTVNLSRTINFDNTRPLRVFSQPEKKAVVRIEDNLGSSETLVEATAGKYQSVNLRGQIGRSYRVVVQTADGATYSSSWEEIAPVPTVDHLETEFAVYDKLFINTNGVPRIAKREGFYMYSVTDDPADTRNFYRWQVDGIFEFFSLTDNANIKQCWAPLTRLESKITIADDTHFNGKRFRQFVCIVPYERPTKFLVKLRQQSMTEKAFHFWEMSLNQQVATGSLFDPPPSAIPGNVTNDNDPEQIVIGYFGASAVAKFDLLIDRFKASGLVAAHPEIAVRPGDCRAHEPGATNIKPEGF